ncbi:MAG: restriction endonuclease [Phycisphaerae bacterium]|jgi:predicted Mrr-cat superfamily restriction endonuclease
MSYFLVRIGEGSKYIEEGRKGGFIAVGWNEVPNLSLLDSLEKIKKALGKTSYQYTPAQIAAQSGQLFRFGLEMHKGDTAISPMGSGEYVVGTVGDYYFEDNPTGGCPYKHRRKVDWSNKTIFKEDMSTNLSYALGATLTIFSLDKYASELRALLAGESYTPADKPQRIRDLILNGLLELGGRGFEEFIKHLLEIIGFSSETTQYVADKNIDVNGTLNAEGLADITLRIQVKRLRASISNKEILALRGALRQEEHGCFITLSTFTKSAIEEAQADGKIPIKLIDGEDLSGLVLRHYDDIDDNYKTLFGIRRKKDFNIEEQFEPALMEKEGVEELQEKAQEHIEWNTLVCAAKEDGFKRAFLEQKAWWAVRLNTRMIPFIKYIAIYQVAPVSKITYYGKVEKIEPYENTGKYKIYLKENPIKLEKSVGLGKNPHLKPQGPRYAKLSVIQAAKTLDDIWGHKI